MLEKRPTTPGPIEPAREQLGFLLLELNRPVEALPEFEASLEKAFRRRGALSGAFHAAELTKDLSKAKHFKSDFRRQAAAKLPPFAPRSESANR